MSPRVALCAAALLLLAFSLSAPADAAGGLSASFAEGCVVAALGQTVLEPLVVSSAASGPTHVEIAIIGSIPPLSNVSISPSSGPAPLASNLTIRLSSDNATKGSYQLGVIVRSGLEEKVVLFTIHVVHPGELAQATTCAPLGLPLPDSTYVVALTSVGLSLLTQVVTRTVVDIGKERSMKAEVAAFKKEKLEATKAKDQAKLERLKKRDTTMTQMEAKISKARLKVTVLTIIPLFGVYYLMATFLGGYGVIVAVSPVPIPLIVGPNGEMVLIWWYFLCSFFSSSVLSRLLRTTT